jgi:hypothetical protein
LISPRAAFVVVGALSVAVSHSMITLRAGNGTTASRVARGSDGPVDNRRACTSGTAISATTGFGGSAHPAMCRGRGVVAGEWTAREAGFVGGSLPVEVGNGAPTPLP